ncbi:MAG: polysaccharide biosynthesis C-terminal domain-containing protein, partial [Clostridium sp.]|uniref:lipid II flippase MurJ n=1 Tax=Clostridium sp. TaxID=1506 RepID=UPI002FCB3E3A
LTFYTPLSIAGVSMAYSISSIVNMYLLYRGLSRKTKGLRTKEISQSFIKASIASFIMGGAALIVARVAESFVGYEGKTEQIIGVGLSMLVAIPLYFFVTYKMRMSEMDFFLAKVKRKLKK